MMKNIKDYGAAGDGKTLDTAAIQSAIDSGGMVYIPAGTYLTGTLCLKSNGGIHLAPGAVLLGSTVREDYNADDFCPQNEVFTSEHVTGAHLIVAVGQENITIEGHGTINGNGRYWMNEKNMSPGWPNPDDFDYVPNKNRPGQLLYICECRNVHVTDVNIENGPYWHLFFHGCENVFVRGLSIRGDRPRWTNDGIDIDCCSHVTVSDCIIDVGDDAITLRAHCNTLSEGHRVCEHVTITNCVIRAHRDNGIRIGVGNGTVRDCLISNTDIEAPNLSGICLVGRWSAESRTATALENIMFSNINVRARTAVEVTVAYGDAPLPNECHISDISFRSLSLFPSECGIILRGTSERILERVSMNSVTLHDPKTLRSGKAVCIENAHNVSLCDFRIAGDDNADIDGCVSAGSCSAISVNGKNII